MKIKMKVKMIKTGIAFDEEYNIENGMDAKEYANGLINSFNATLRPNESPRELIRVEIINNDTTPICKHNWEKQNLITVIKGGGNHDIMKCSVCGITGKRYGLSKDVERDSKYKAKVYETCQGAIKQLNKLKG